MATITPTFSQIARSDDGKGEIVVVSDATLNDTAKLFVVPALQYWKVLSVYFSLITTATAGNRLMSVDFLDATPALIARCPFGAVQAATLTWNYTAFPGSDKLAAVAGVALALTAPIPGGLWLPPGYGVKIIDTAAVDAGADDISLRFVIERRRFA